MPGEEKKNIFSFKTYKNQISFQRDSGSPLTCRNPSGTTTVCGLVSFGFGCGVDGFPGVYTEVSYYIEWVDEHITD